MKARKLLIFLLCFVLVIASVAVIAAAQGATETESYTEVTNDDGTVTTKYGTIPSTYADSATYPFVVFRYKNGTLDSVSAQKTMRAALNNAKDWNNTWNKILDDAGQKTGENDTANTYASTVLLRRDYTTIKYTDSSNVGDKFDNYAQMQNECVVDLNGYTITQGDGTSAIFFQVTSKPSSSQGYVFSTKYTFKNGDMALNDKPLFYGNIWNNLYNSDGTLREDYSMADKHFTFNFENITFKYVSGATAANMMFSFTGPQGLNDAVPKTPVVPAPFYFTYTDCTFDLTNAPSSAITLFNANPTESQWLKITVTTNGCEIIAPANKLANLTLYKTETVHGSSVTFAADENGDVLTLTLPEGETPAAPTASTYVTVDGKQLYWHNVDGVYVLTECADSETNHACSCGTIYTACSDADSDNLCDDCGAYNAGGTWISDENASAYPFAILDASGAYSSLQTTWKNATNAAKAIDGSTIVLLRDYTNGSGDNNNLKDFGVEFTVDLNGYTLTRGYSGAYLFDNWWDASTTADTVKVTFKNGTLNAEKWLICLSGSDAIANAKQADFVFEDVTFKFAAKNDQNYGWIFEVHSQTYNKQITTNITFTDCTFDTTDMRSSITMTAAPALNLDVNNKSGVDYVKATVTFNGGKIIANRFATYALYQVHDDDTVTFGKGSDENYLTLEMPNGKAPTTPAEADYITVGGESVYFHAATVGEANTTYTLTKCIDPATNHECTCGLVYSSECIDEDKNHMCDICGETSECVDENVDHICDLCEKSYTCVEADMDKDHICDFCGEEFACTDANEDEICDHCGYVINDYGIKNIPATYASTDTYPFFVLKYQNGVYTFVHAASTFYGRQAGASAIGYSIYSVLRDANRYDLESGTYVPQVDGSTTATAIVVMRRDYELKMGKSSMDTSTGVEYFDNIAHLQGELIINLGGHTLSEAEGSIKSMFYITAKGWTGNPDKNNGYNDFTFPSTLTVTNGRLESLNYAAATIATTDAIEATEGFSISNSVFNLNFDGVKFGFVDGAEATELAYATGGATNKYDGVAKVNVSFTGCTFDLKTVAPTVNVNLVNNDTTGKDVDCDVVIEGCKILASDMSNVTVYKSSTTNGSSTTVKKSEDGSYITLSMPEGSTAPAVTNTVVIDNGVVCAFVKTSTADENDNYVLYPAVMVGYKIKTSVTLYSNFVYNIYIPKSDVKEFTVNEKTVGYTTETIDGVEYYCVAVNLAAGEALSDIALTVTLNSGETTVDANWTLSVLKYAKSVLNGEYVDTIKTLIRDMLVYASAAHTYFENTADVADKLTEIETLLDGYSKDAPEGEAKTPASKTYFTDVAVYVGEVPSFRFYLADGYTANDFTFTVGGDAVDVTEDSGYVEIVMYAYRMLDDVTFTVNETEVSESYNLYSYYEFVTDPDNTASTEELVAIVKGLMNYSVSAKAYREYYLENYCDHNYENGACTKCGEADPDVGTMSLTAPASIYSNYAGKDISVTFSKDWYNKEVTYTTDNENVFVENGKIYATGTFSSAVDVTVTATTEDHTATATVNVSTFVGDGRNVSAETKVQWYENNIIKEENKGGMIFVGDSYFDGAGTVPAFWRDFYEDYAGEKAFLMGISSSQIGDLEVVSERLVYPMEPSEIVVHIGFNDVHSGSLTTDELIERITALVTEYHEKLPNAKIYYCGVEPKKGGYDSTSSFYSSSTERAPALTAAMQALSEANDWFVYVDTLSIFVRNYGTEDAAVNNNMYYLTDASHPTLHAYDLMRFMIDEARGKETDVIRLFDSAEQITGVTSVTAGGVYLTDNNGAAITTATGDFVISGKLAITNLMLSNAHIQFRFKSGSRFLLWDKDSDGIFYANGASASTEKFDANESIVLDWAVVVQSGVAYLYIDGNLEATLEVPDIQEFNIGVSHLDLTLYDVSFSATTDADYSTHMEKYSGERIYVENYSGATAIANTGTTYTADLDGNALTGNYVMRGSLEIYKLKLSNAHLQFNFGNSYRFLLWDNDKDGYFGAGYQTPDEHTNETVTGELYHAKSGVLTLDWAIVVKDGTAYWYINGELVCTFAGENLDFSSVLVGAVCMNVLIYDVEIYAEEGNSENYNAVASEYLD